MRREARLACAVALVLDTSASPGIAQAQTGARAWKREAMQSK